MYFRNRLLRSLLLREDSTKYKNWQASVVSEVAQGQKKDAKTSREECERFLSVWLNETSGSTHLDEKYQKLIQELKDRLRKLPDAPAGKKLPDDLTKMTDEQAEELLQAFFGARAGCAYFAIRPIFIGIFSWDALTKEKTGLFSRPLNEILEGDVKVVVMKAGRSEEVGVGSIRPLAERQGDVTMEKSE